ncbi:biotin-dependent carboxylase-like uncharacterized protein [Saonia flava]|uniref:Biotin-dependent carboxylase-like uncharacterized protein n=1 Tax=Saonia flava TaxID=523696 RepID=A0A846QZP9_9FLAO|nr:biotin-dependent carboxyltransferase family protein [Saonia flava]NJB70079.1 biotin-dependent carboxylase-like uncharacterized protein [Saonia flava]
MLKVLKSGFFTTIQDRGRFNFRDKGVPVSGVMDSYSFHKANKLLKNNENAAALEITMTGPTLEFEEDTYIVLGGAEMSATLNSEPIVNCKVYKIEKGDIVSFGKLEKGFRSYLAIKGGFKVEDKLGSKSLYYPITPNAYIKKGAEIPYDAYPHFHVEHDEFPTDSFLTEVVLEVYKGPEYDLLNDKHLEALFFREFSIAKENNRMAYQLEDLIKGHSFSMLTSATLPGTVQLTPSGKLIVLMKDGQTTGGYPRILQLSDRAISILAQKKSGDKVSFKLK